MRVVWTSCHDPGDRNLACLFTFSFHHSRVQRALHPFQARAAECHSPSSTVPGTRAALPPPDSGTPQMACSSCVSHDLQDGYRSARSGLRGTAVAVCYPLGSWAQNAARVEPAAPCCAGAGEWRPERAAWSAILAAVWSGRRAGMGASQRGTVHHGQINAVRIPDDLDSSHVSSVLREHLWYCLNGHCNF